MKAIFTIALRSLLRHRKKAAFTVIGVTVSVIMMVMMCALCLSLVDLQYSIMLADRQAQGHTDLAAIHEYIITHADYGLVKTLAILFATLTVLGAVGGIYSALTLNMREKTKTIATLSTVGATASHGAALLLFDALLVSTVAIPVGLGAGLGMVYPIVQGFNRISETLSEGDYTIPPIPFLHGEPLYFMLCMAALSLAAVTIASLRPAPQLFRKAPIEMARTKDGIRVRLKPSLTDRLMERLFGVTGRLAAVNYTNNKHSYRLISLPISVTALLYILAVLVIRYVSGMDTGDLTDPSERQFVLLLSIFMALFLTVALFGGFCQLFVHFQKRRGEFAMLASMGMDSRQMHGLVSLEALYYGLYLTLYILAGALAGNAVLFATFRMTDPSVGLISPWREIGVSLVVVAGAVWILSLMMIRTIRKIRIVEELKA